LPAFHGLRPFLDSSLARRRSVMKESRSSRHAFLKRSDCFAFCSSVQCLPKLEFFSPIRFLPASLSFLLLSSLSYLPVFPPRPPSCRFVSHSPLAQPSAISFRSRFQAASSVRPSAIFFTATSFPCFAMTFLKYSFLRCFVSKHLLPVPFPMWKTCPVLM
jgi:hypothetical protein